MKLIKWTYEQKQGDKRGWVEICYKTKLIESAFFAMSEMTNGNSSGNPRL